MRIRTVINAQRFTFIAKTSLLLQDWTGFRILKLRWRGGFAREDEFS